MSKPPPIQTKYVVLEGSTQNGLYRLSKFFGLKKIFFTDCYCANYNSSIIVFKFSSEDRKKKASEVENLEAELLKLKIKVYTPPVRSESPSRPVKDPNHTDIAIFQLSPAFFFPDENVEVTPTIIKDLITKLENELKNHDSIEKDSITNFHFHQDIRKANIPKTAKLTFKTKALADKFLEEDTVLGSGVLLATNKRLHIEVKIPLCKTCRKSTHSASSIECDRIERCPRCLSTDHPQPTQTCEPTCWTHGKGHSTISERCENNRAYKKRKREEITTKINEDRIIQEIDPQFRALHKETTELNKKLSWAKVAMANPPSTSQAITQRPISKKAHTIDMVSLAEVYTYALMDEAHCPGQGKFEDKLKAYEIRNGWPVLNHPPADWDVIQALSPSAIRPIASSTPAASISEFDDNDVDSNGPVSTIAPKTQII